MLGVGLIGWVCLLLNKKNSGIITYIFMHREEGRRRRNMLRMQRLRKVGVGRRVDFLTFNYYYYYFEYLYYYMYTYTIRRIWGGGSKGLNLGHVPKERFKSFSGGQLSYLSWLTFDVCCLLVFDQNQTISLCYCIALHCIALHNRECKFTHFHLYSYFILHFNIPPNPTHIIFRLGLADLFINVKKIV